MGLAGAIYIFKLNQPNCPKFLNGLAILIDYTVYEILDL
jgi:hypothetical protein